MSQFQFVKEKDASPSDDSYNPFVPHFFQIIHGGKEDKTVEFSLDKLNKENLNNQDKK